MDILSKKLYCYKGFIDQKKEELINKKEFPQIALNKNVKTFIIYITTLLEILIYLSRKTWFGFLLADEAFTKIFTKYLDFANIFLSQLYLSDLL